MAPWRALRRQLAEDVAARFWKIVGVDSAQWPKQVIELFPSTAADEISKRRRTGVVFVGTIQAVQNIYSKHREVYDAIRRRIALVIVDEGHREPALEWAKAVRAFGKPTVLFTATPYRNDFKLFDVDPEHVYAYSHRQAVKERYIRDIKFVERQFGDSTKNFVQSLREFYDGEFQTLKPFSDGEPRVKVRCENNDEVNDVASLLEQEGEKVIAIHERFSGKPKGIHRRNVPKNPRKQEARYWVHQFKLIEGLDDPRFSLLAIYQPLRNARALVQQIGRIVRNPDRKPGQLACVICKPSDRQRSFWDGYREYDRRYGEDEKKGEIAITRRGLFDNILKLHPKYHYVQGNFRKRFQFDLQAAIYLGFRYPKSTSVYKTGADFSMESFEDLVQSEWAENDLDIRLTDYPDGATVVYTYVTYANSPLLLDSFLMEYRLGFTIMHRAGPYLFFYDSEGNFCSEMSKGLTRVPPGQLEKLFAEDTLRVAAISMLNTDLGQHSVRRRTVSARSLSDTAPGLVDHAHFCSTVSGYTYTDRQEIVRRYLGLSRGRITESSAVPLDYHLYIDWLNSLAGLLTERNRTPVTLFERFARFADVPDDPTPVNILFDLDDVENAFETSLKVDSVKEQAQGVEAVVVEETGIRDKKVRALLVLDDVCYGISRKGKSTSGSFSCRANGRRYEVAIRYDEKKKGYLLASPALERAYVNRDAGGGSRENLVGYLNRSQSFRVITRSEGLIYAHGHFYEPRLPLWGNVPSDRFDLLTVFKKVADLSRMSSEKGETCRADGSGWEEGSIFNLIDTLGKGTALYDELRGIDILVCDDLGTEIADFVAVDTVGKRVIFLHAKAVPTPAKRSGTKLQDVCQQATKNLDPLQPFSVTIPPNLERWSLPWALSDVGSVQRRIRMPEGESDPKALWDRIRQVIRDPSTSREVWLVLGQMFSLTEFESQRSKQRPAPEIVQILYLIKSTWSSVSSVGASLRIYCSE